ncbi:MAG: peroxiredoxin [Phycisphaeraceae bacterium]|nr:MAG: peroxiredoxin [Phycisphaeraceae bacterium]
MPTPIATGTTAPDFTLPDQNRDEWTLSEHVKKGDVVLCFFPFAFTGVCGTEMACITKDMGDWTAKGATVVGISCDSFAALKAWADAEGIKSTLLADLHRTVCKDYGLYWADMNVANRGTVVIGQSDDGKGTVTFSEAREPGDAMDWDAVLARVS